MPPRAAVAEESQGVSRVAFGVLEPAREHIRLNQVRLEKCDGDQKSDRSAAGVALLEQSEAAVHLPGQRPYPAEGTCHEWPDVGDTPVVADRSPPLEIRCRTGEVSPRRAREPGTPKRLARLKG